MTLVAWQLHGCRHQTDSRKISERVCVHLCRFREQASPGPRPSFPNSILLIMGFLPNFLVSRPLILINTTSDQSCRGVRNLRNSRNSFLSYSSQSRPGPWRQPIDAFTSYNAGSRRFTDHTMLIETRSRSSTQVELRLGVCGIFSLLLLRNQMTT